jgi:hypothetical protein
MSNPAPENTVETLHERIWTETTSGIKHGFSKFHVAIEIVPGGRRRVLVQAGKSWSFLIDPDDVRLKSV